MKFNSFNLLKIFFSFILSVVIIFNAKCNEISSPKWMDLVPKNAYDFVPETGVTDEMWEDEGFLKKVEKAGLLVYKDLVGKKIRIDGFMVPLDFDYGEALTVEEFVLVPDAGMCIHVPPPPPNQMILVKLKSPEKVRFMYQPIAIEGVLKNTKPIEEVYNSIYEMEAESVQDIDMDELNY